MIGSVYEWGLSFLSCSANFCKWASTSSALAQPLKYKHSISNVRLLGLRPVHRLMSRLAISATYTWMVTPFLQFDSKWRQPRMHLNQRKNSSIIQRYL